jgi:hypothetical protein
MKIFGLKCDAAGCDYQDMSITRDMYEACINLPCPTCGAPLLTQADYDAILQLEKVEKNPLFSMMGIDVNVSLDGTGMAGAKFSKK